MSIFLQFFSMVNNISLRKMYKYLFAMIALAVAWPAVAQSKKQVVIQVSPSAVFKFHAQKPAVLSCSASGRVLKCKGGDVQVAFYAQNDLRQVPMQLYKEDDSLQNVQSLRKAKKNKYYPVFSASLEQLFTLNPAQTPYRWKWGGRAKAPVSPVADVAGGKVKEIKCWAIVRAGNKTYTSDTTTIQVQQ